MRNYLRLFYHTTLQVILIILFLATNAQTTPFDCSGAVDLGCGGSYSGSTTGASQVPQYNCVFWDESGPEAIFSITPTERGSFFAQISDLSADLDIFLLADCDDSHCVDYADDIIFIPDLFAGSYFLIVDGYEGASGNFTLDVVADCIPTPTPIGTWFSPTPTHTPKPTRTPLITPTFTFTLGMATSTPTNTPTNTFTATFTASDTPSPVPTPPDSCDAEEFLFSFWDRCERLQAVMTPPPSHGANRWYFDDCDYCRDAGNPCFTVPCTFAMYVVAECGTEFHVPLWDNETGHIRIKDCIKNEYVSMRGTSTGGWNASGTDIQWEDCSGINPLWNNEMTDIFFSGAPTVCGVYRVEFIDWGGFIWELFANCDGTRTPVFMIYDNYDTAVSSFHLYPELSLSNLKVTGICPVYDITFDVANSGCSTIDVPVCLSTTLGGLSWKITVPGVGPGEVVQGCTRVIVPDCPFGDYDFVAEVDCDDIILECNEVPGGALGCSFGPSFSDTDTETVHVVPTPTPTPTPVKPTPTPVPAQPCCWHLFKNEGPDLNTAYLECNPWMASDNTSLFFDSERIGTFGGHDIYLAIYNGADWIDVFNIGPTVNTTSDEGAATLTFDRKWLFFHSNRAAGVGGFDLYTSQWVGTGFTASANLGVIVNTSFDEIDPCVSPDGKILYFSSNRIGSLDSSYDIYMCTRASVFNPWGTPVHLDPPINSSADELGPIISPDLQSLYFESDIEGERILYQSYLVSGGWDTPHRMCVSMQKSRRPSFNESSTKTYFYTDEGTVYGREDIWEAVCNKTPIPTEPHTNTPTSAITATNTPTPVFTPTITPTFTPPCGIDPPVYFGSSFSPGSCVPDLAPDIGIDVQSAAVGLDTSLALHQYSIDGGINWLPMNSEAETLGFDPIFTDSVVDSEAINGLARFASFDSGTGKLCKGPGATGLQTGKEYVTCFRMKISPTNCQNDLALIQIRTASAILKEQVIRASDFYCHYMYNEVPVHWIYDGSGAIDTEITFYPGITDLYVDVIKTFLIGSVTGIVGSLATERQTGIAVPFNQVSATLNRARFAIYDTDNVLSVSDSYNVCIVAGTITPVTGTPTFTHTPSGPRVPLTGTKIPVLFFLALTFLLLLFAARRLL
ncbi:MAG: hypothetical protein A2161_06515 [Candidatus Schekmanbacteria bacterium RBG_13_48_7]|uniref:Uncharacterized protein n=1 Tax=Candidatus Schekmanbacteria bacterium RBG_13_48_7 TaxID=1817878 RepID=A0A1F7S6U5_9BACT|nr:MAG: hypothetical protein A2161_06515 [Candidatus Schekmanbacteria bacterium RBG_13_48_7]